MTVLTFLVPSLMLKRTIAIPASIRSTIRLTVLLSGLLKHIKISHTDLEA